MKGKLYGIGVGPGDPELMTLKAVKTIQICSVIAIPKAGDGESVAYTIAKRYLEGKELVECRFAMERDMVKRKEARQTAANHIAAFLDNGQDVGFITLGDPTTYSTYMYVHEIIVNKGFETEIIPGIISYTAAAAALGIALCEGNEPLMVIPARYNEKIGELLEYPGNKVIMKSGENLISVLAKLKECGHGYSAKIACRVTMDGERLYSCIEDYENSPELGYFTTAIIKEKDMGEDTA